MIVRHVPLVAILAILVTAVACDTDRSPPAADGRPAIDGPRTPPWPQRPIVDAALDMAPDLSGAVGTESVLFTPDRPVCEVVFRNWANRPSATADGSSAQITRATVDRAAVTPREESAGAAPGAPGTLVELPLPACVDAGTPIPVELGFRITLGADSTERLGRSPDGRTAWLGSALPLLAWVRGRGWARDPAVRMQGETATSEDFRLERLDVTAAPDQTIVGTGTAQGEPAGPAPGRVTHRFVADAIRDVDLAVGDYELTEHVSGSVRVHVARPRSGTRASADDWAGEIDRRLTGLQGLLGPFPYPDLWATVVPSQADGVEFPGAVQFGDKDDASMPGLVAHELAHQWFYALVGNNQARDPWLDESFATLAEALAADERDDYQIADYTDAHVGRIGAPMGFWDANGGFQAYSEGVYNQGAATLLFARDQVGPRRFDAALRAYLDTNAHRVASPYDVQLAFRDLPEVIAALRDHGAFADPDGPHPGGATSAPAG